MKRIHWIAAGFLASFCAGMSLLWPGSPAIASDHGDAPNVSGDQAADIGDTYLFLDPNDNTKVIMIMTFRGFIVPGEAVNFTTFDPDVLYRFEIENTGDAKPDAAIDVTFSQRTASGEPQTATILLSGKGEKKMKFVAPTTVSTLAATPPAPAVTTDPASGVAFFAGQVDDPFFFDSVAFGRFVASVKAGAPDPTIFNRGRDTFAGYNILSIALSVPKALIQGKNNNIIGVDAITFRRTQTPTKTGEVRTMGPYRRVDRSGNPAVNVALIPYKDKDLYNASTTVDDAKGKFVPDIEATLKPFGTDAAHIGILASVAVTKGDFEHVDVTIPNTGTGGGTNTQAAFPDGRRLGDDVIDTLLTIINNGNALGDNVNANDVPFLDQFPFLAPPHQPLPAGVVDDGTRN